MGLLDSLAFTVRMPVFAVNSSPGTESTARLLAIALVGNVSLLRTATFMFFHYRVMERTLIRLARHSSHATKTRLRKSTSPMA